MGTKYADGRECHLGQISFLNADILRVESLQTDALHNVTRANCDSKGTTINRLLGVRCRSVHRPLHQLTAPSSRHLVVSRGRQGPMNRAVWVPRFLPLPFRVTYLTYDSTLKLWSAGRRLNGSRLLVRDPSTRVPLPRLGTCML